MNMPLLVIDCGNTRLKWGLRDGAAWAGQGALSVARLDSLTVRAERIVACNVAGDQAGAAIESLAARMVAPLHWVRAQSAHGGVTNGYEHPDQLGADRWAALIGARHSHAGPCLVVTAGTATTVDLLSAAGDFLGGLILPGVELMQQALARGTAQLPLAEGRFAWQPRRTVDAIRSGCLQAQTGAVERMFRQIAAHPGALCLLGGGAADSFADLLEIPLRRTDNLVLTGLGTVATLPAPPTH